MFICFSELIRNLLDQIWFGSKWNSKNSLMSRELAPKKNQFCLASLEQIQNLRKHKNSTAEKLTEVHQHYTLISI